MNDDYEKLVSFWNNNFILTADDKKELEANHTNYLSLAPNTKLVDALKLFISCNNILDYGCGNGWASIILGKLGINHINAVDVAENSIEVVNALCDIYNLHDNVDAIHIDDKWLSNEKSNSYDGFFSSNVIDVIPYDMSVEVIKNAARIVKDDSYVIFSMNYYIDTLNLNVPGYIVKGSHIYIDGILRLNSLSDIEWIDIFNKYFKNVEVKYFSWPGEDEEKRRLFILKK